MRHGELCAFLTRLSSHRLVLHASSFALRSRLRRSAAPRVHLNKMLVLFETWINDF